MVRLFTAVATDYWEPGMIRYQELIPVQKVFPGDDHLIPFPGYFRDGFRELWMIVQDMDKITPVQDKEVAEGLRSDRRRSSSSLAFSSRIASGSKERGTSMQT